LTDSISSFEARFKEATDNVTGFFGHGVVVIIPLAGMTTVASELPQTEGT
jgi:hypothetical protein